MNVLKNEQLRNTVNNKNRVGGKQNGTVLRGCTGIRGFTAHQKNGGKNGGTVFGGTQYSGGGGGGIRVFCKVYGLISSLCISVNIYETPPYLLK